MSKTFDVYNIIMVKVEEDDLMSFLLKNDIDDDAQPIYPLELLTEEIMSVIPEYAYADYEGNKIEQTKAYRKLREAAKAIYKIKEFNLMYKVYCSTNEKEREQARIELDKMPFRNRGEFGELILHFLLRDFKETTPLISKVYFKDSAGVPAHGFDAVHLSPHDEILWLGESKLYTDAKDGIRALVKDLDEHLKTDYLNEQFVLIGKNVKNNSIPNREFWMKKLAESGTLKDKLKFINIPMLCVYENDIYDKFYDTETDEALAYHKVNVRELKAYFDEKNKNPLRDRCNVVLFLLPIKSKEALVKRLHERLWHMQNM